MSARSLERRLVGMLDEFGANPTDAQREEYRALWEEWLAEAGIGKPVTYGRLPRDVVPTRPKEVTHGEDRDGQLSLA